MKMQIAITVLENPGIVSAPPLRTEIVLPHPGKMFIDHTEQVILAGMRTAMVEAANTCFTTWSEGLAQETARQQAGRIVRQTAPYRVAGEIGQLEFPLYRFVPTDPTSGSPDLFEPLGPRESYQTQGFVELLLRMAVQESYRETAESLDRVRGQKAGSTSVAMVGRVVEREGTAIHTTREQWTSEVLAEHGFSETAQPLQADRFPWDTDPDQAGWDPQAVEVVRQQYNRHHGEGDQIPPRSYPVFL